METTIFDGVEERVLLHSTHLIVGLRLFEGIPVRNRRPHTIEEVVAMELKTIAIRTEPELHAKLQLLAQLSGHTLAEELREALDEHIARKGQKVDLTKQAQTALAEIDKDAAARRKAIESLLSGSTKPENPEGKKPRGGKRNA